MRKRDWDLTAEELRARYGDTAHPKFGVDAWRRAVTEAEICSGAPALAGYWAWVADQLQHHRQLRGKGPCTCSS